MTSFSARERALFWTIEFLRSISLSVTEEAGVKGFLDDGGVLIHDGGIFYDPARAWPSDMIHEAGHLAILPPRWRPVAQRDVTGAITAMFEDIEILNLPPDHALYRAALQCSDQEATAWAWAAGMHLELPPKLIVRDCEYEAKGRSVRDMLLTSKPRNGRVTGYLGIHGLAHAGMTALHDHGPVPMYPKMRVWLQDAEP